MKRMFEKIYVQLVQVLDTNLVGFMAGIVSGIAINIATGGNLNSDSRWCIIFLGVAVVLMLILIRIRQAVDQEYKWRENIPNMTQDKLDNESVDPGNIRRTVTYCLAFILIIVFVGNGIRQINLSINKSERMEDDSKKMMADQQKQLQQLIFRLQESIDTIRTVQDSRKVR
jgi:hypothetical protein